MKNQEKINQYTEEILNTIENKDNLTQSDLQGIIEAIVMNLVNTSN